MGNIGYIYKIFNDINDNVYIGQTVQTINARFWQHKNDAKKGSMTSLHLAIMKYGEGHFFIEKIEECEISELDNREKYWIEYYNSYKDGYNMTPGGSGVYSSSTPKRAKIDDNLIFSLWDEGKSISEIVEETGYSKSAVKNHIKKYSNYSIEESNKRGSHKQAITRQKPIVQVDIQGNIISYYTSAREADEKTNISYQDISYAANNGTMAGGYYWCFKNIEDKNKKFLVIQYDIDGKIINKYNTIKEAAEITHGNLTGICQALNGKQKTSGGFIWKKEYISGNSV